MRLYLPLYQVLYTHIESNVSVRRLDVIILMTHVPRAVWFNLSSPQTNFIKINYGGNETAKCSLLIEAVFGSSESPSAGSLVSACPRKLAVCYRGRQVAPQMSSTDQSTSCRTGLPMPPALWSLVPSTADPNYWLKQHPLVTVQFRLAEEHCGWLVVLHAPATNRQAALAPLSHGIWCVWLSFDSPVTRTKPPGLPLPHRNAAF